MYHNIFEIFLADAAVPVAEAAPVVVAAAPDVAAPAVVATKAVEVHA